MKKQNTRIELFQWQYTNMLQILPNPEGWLMAGNRPECKLHIPQRPNPIDCIDDDSPITTRNVAVMELSFHINRDGMIMYWQPNAEITIIQDHLSYKMGRE